ncbi:sulfotransferase family protein [Aurantiacibacter marinus]|uniref:sulfotransferase family protein n=1 Tax=Aurantiacibacter marinus TaxID=874156 RepID=UPI0009E213BF|nr:sulfotransferase [Aurantiacibacter marinus]
MSPPPRPHPLSRSPLVDRTCGWLESAWSKGLLTRPTLDPDVLFEKACKDATPSAEHGIRAESDIADFRLRLTMLTASLTEEAKLNPLGLTIAHGQLVRVIRQRLELGALWSDQPGLAGGPLAAPVIIAGQMRSGTTRLHRLLAADPQFSSTRFCDSWLPVPRRPDTRPAWSAISLLFARKLDPWLDSIHPFGVTRADEELGWLACALNHGTYEAQWRVPTFTAFSESRDPAPVYREFARILSTDAHYHGNADRPRVLKVPQFAEDLPALLAQFPNARVILTKRCDQQTANSAASLVANQMTIQSDDVDMDWIEAEMGRKISLRQSRMDAAIANFTGPKTTVDFDALGDDWKDVIGQVYSDLGILLPASSLSAMQGEHDRAAVSAHHAHAKQYRAFAQSGV